MGINCLVKNKLQLSNKANVSKNILNQRSLKRGYPTPWEDDNAFCIDCTSFEGRMKFTILLPLLICAGLLAKAQNIDIVKSNIIIGLHLQGGFIAPHRDEMKHLVQGHSVGGSLSLLKKCDGKKYWQHIYNFPENGLDFWFNSTGNSRQLGNQVDLKYLLNLPLNQNKNPDGQNLVRNESGFKHWLGLGIGLGYSTKIWDLRENHQAAVLGSHINASLTIQYSASIIRTKSFDLRSGLRVTHFSNGASQIPNLGTNNLGLFIGLYVRKNSGQAPFKYDFIPTIEKWRNTISLATGYKEVQPPMSKKYATFSMTFLKERRITFKSSVGAGIDLFYNSSLIKLMEREITLPKKSTALQAGLLLSYTMHFDRFELKMQNGFYVLDQWKNDGFIYHRFGLRYRCTKHLFAQLTLKTHFAKADFTEAGIGYAF